MRIGWRQYIKRKLTKQSPFSSIGLGFTADALHVSVFKHLGDDSLWTHQHTFGLQDWHVKLENWVKQVGAQRTPCHVVYAINWYQLLQVDRPQVQQDEMRQALTWSVQELLESNAPHYVDYFDPPCQIAGTDKVNVVAMPQKDLTTLARHLLDCELELKSIGIEELAICELLPRSDEAVMTLVQEPGQEICLNIIKNGQLYFSRRLKGFENLAGFSIDELQMGIVDSLCVQVQRSMDYFDSQLRQPPVKRILIALDSPLLEELARQIHQLTFLPVESFHPDVPSQQGLDVGAASFVSLGAALTQDTSVGAPA